MTDTAAEQWPLCRSNLLYPTPVAIACGRVTIPAIESSTRLETEELVFQRLVEQNEADTASRSNSGRS